MTDNYLDTSTFSPRLIRLLQLAVIESKRNGNEDLRGPHEGDLLVGALQDDQNWIAELLHNAGLTLADVRSGNFSIKAKL